MFTRVSAAEYYGGSRIGEVTHPYATLVKVLGEPHKRAEPDYPDDDDKTDVCWCVRSVENPKAIVTIWNYKNGPAYNSGEGSVEELDYFSAYYSDAAFFEEIKKALAGVALTLLVPGHPRWEEFVERLEGPEGCDFQEEHGKTTWKCAGGNDKSLAIAIIEGMAIENIDLPATLAYLGAHGGHCDCEILFNVNP